MKCPKCLTSLEPFHLTQNYVIDECPDCHGMWFDKGELAQLLSVEGSGVFDQGVVRETKKLNFKKDVKCPRCAEQALSTILHPKQKNLYYEICPGCQGIWLDGGELKDLKQEGIMAFFKSFLT